MQSSLGVVGAFHTSASQVNRGGEKLKTSKLDMLLAYHKVGSYVSSTTGGDISNP